MVKIRLKRLGAKRNPIYRVVVINSRDKREGRPIEELGFYNPKRKELRLDKEKALEWIKKGAQTTETVQYLIDNSDETGALIRKEPEGEKLSKKAKAKLETEAKAKQEAEAKAKEEAKAKAEEEKKAKEEAEAKAKQEAEAAAAEPVPVEEEAAEPVQAVEEATTKAEVEVKVEETIVAEEVKEEANPEIEEKKEAEPEKASAE